MNKRSTPRPAVRQSLFGENIRVVDVVDRRWQARIQRRIPSRGNVGFAFRIFVFLLMIAVFGGSMFFVAYLYKSGAWYGRW